MGVSGQDKGVSRAAGCQDHGLDAYGGAPYQELGPIGFPERSRQGLGLGDGALGSMQRVETVELGQVEARRRLEPGGELGIESPAPLVAGDMKRGGGLPGVAQEGLEQWGLVLGRQYWISPSRLVKVLP